MAVANFLIDKGANIHARNERKSTPLYFSIKDFDLTQRLINMGADVNIRAYGDFTPLHMYNDIKIARLLIDNGAKIFEYTIQNRGTNDSLLKNVYVNHLSK